MLTLAPDEPLFVTRGLPGSRSSEGPAGCATHGWIIMLAVGAEDVSRWLSAQRQMRRAVFAWRRSSGVEPSHSSAGGAPSVRAPDLFGSASSGGSRNLVGFKSAARRMLRGLLSSSILQPQTRFNQDVAAELTAQATRLAELEERTRHWLETRPTATAALERGLEQLTYVAFEDRFRGESNALAARQREYVDYFADRGEVIDIGCGRGEFLTLLRDKGIPARGIDLDASMVNSCREHGIYNVERADALEYLRRQPDRVFGGVFMSQVVEHLTTPELLSLLEVISRTCSTGAVLIVETLNPESLPVLARWHWLDPTHTRLVHPETMQFFMEEAGFTVKTVQFRQPLDQAQRLPRLQLGGVDAGDLERYNESLESLNDSLFGPLDYFVVGVRDEPRSGSST